jgi:ABC-type Na+ efflux pump permease subunit
VTTRLDRSRLVEPWVVALVISALGAGAAAVAHDFGVFLLFAFPATVGAILAVIAELIDWRRGIPADHPMSAVQLLSTFGASVFRPEKGPPSTSAEGASDAERRC